MNSLDWLIGRRFQSIERCEHDWVLVFEGRAVIVISCLWRLLEHGHIKITSEDHEQQFGLPAPVNAADETNRSLGRSSVESVSLNGETLDLALAFSSSHIFQILPDSGGHESWIASNDTSEFIAVGSGRLDTIPVQRR